MKHLSGREALRPYFRHSGTGVSLISGEVFHGLFDVETPFHFGCVLDPFWLCFLAVFWVPFGCVLGCRFLAAWCVVAVTVQPAAVPLRACHCGHYRGGSRWRLCVKRLHPRTTVPSVLIANTDGMVAPKGSELERSSHLSCLNKRGNLDGFWLALLRLVSGWLLACDGD